MKIYRMKHYLIVVACLFALNLFLFNADAQDDRSFVIQGTVTSALDNEPLIGVSITELDATNRVVGGTTTNLNGDFVLRSSNQNNKLVFSYLGFQKHEVKIGEQRRINVRLVDESQVIDEVVIKADKRTTSQGGFSIPTREVSVAMQSINTSEFEGLQVTSIDDALQGQIAGLDIVMNSGDPGSSSSMRIRGVNSINADSEPLIVLNGSPWTMNIDPQFDYANSNEEQYANMLSINPDDIEDITVLKDAASSAIWGSRGANGVIMITTKKGSSGPTRVTYTYRYTNNRQPEGRKMLNGDDYTMYIKEAYLNPQQDDNANNIPEYNYDPNFPEYENFNNNTDWRKQVIQTSQTHSHNLTIAGGGTRATYRLSGEYLSQGGTMIGQKLERFSSRLAFDYRVSDRIKFLTETSISHTDNKRNYQGLLDIAYNKMPNLSVYAQDRDGNDTDEYYNISRESGLSDSQKNLRNPVALAHLASSRGRSTRINPKIGIEYFLLNPEEQYLRFKADVNFDLNTDKTNTFLPASATNLVWTSGDVNRATDASTERLNIFADVNLEYHPKFKNDMHTMVLYGGTQITTGNNSSQNIVTSGLPSVLITDASNPGWIESANNGRSSWKGIAFLGRLHYVFKGRYVIGGNIRWDGNTRFGKGNRWGVFPGVSGKWIISDESFLDKTDDWLNMLALRVSWGISGGQPGAEYLHFSRYSIYGSYIDMPAIRPASLRLDDLKWQTTNSANYGLEVELFKNKFSLDFNYYTSRTEDMLFSNVRIPNTSGFSSLSYINGGVMENKGWELYLNFNRFINYKNFSADFKLNFADNTNTLIELYRSLLEGYNTDYDYRNGSYLTRIQENNSFGSIYGFRYKGVYKYDKYEKAMEMEGRIIDEKGKPLAPFATDAQGNIILDENGNPKPLYYAYNKEEIRYKFRGGDAIYEDVNNDGSIDELDIVYLGNANPKFNGGFGLNLRYKRFSLRSHFNFRYGNKIINSSRMNAENMYSDNNQSIAVNWRWRRDGDDTDMPRALYNFGYNWLGSDRYVEDGSFLRFKYIQLNYDVPASFLRKYSLNRLTVYLTLNNLHVWTKYTGVDPEVGYGGLGLSKDGNSTPRTKEVIFGLTIGI